jgi:hypothetical protein
VQMRKIQDGIELGMDLSGRVVELALDTRC